MSASVSSAADTVLPEGALSTAIPLSVAALRSMLSTPILNPPQSAVLGMHNIIERPVVVNNKVEVRPVMYLALSYDHRIIDGKEAVSFLKIVKESLEQPKRLFLNI